MMVTRGRSLVLIFSKSVAHVRQIFTFPIVFRYNNLEISAAAKVFVDILHVMWKILITLYAF